MPLQILKPTPKKDQLTTIAQALGIAKDIYGIVGQSKQLDALTAKADIEEKERERLKRGELYPGEAAELTKGGRKLVPTSYGPQEEGAIGGYTLGGVPMTLLPKKGLDLEGLKTQETMLNIEKLKQDIKQKQKEISAYLTPGQKKVDEDFAKEYADFYIKGKYAEVQGDIKNLEGYIDKLGSSDFITGPVISVFPDWIRKRLFEKSMTVQQGVEKVVQRNLKLTLGGQFTEREGILFMQRGYDPALSEEENQRRVKDIVNRIKLAAEAKQKASEWYQKHGSLKDYKGVINLKEIIYKDIDLSQEPSEEAVKRYSPGFREGGIPGGAKPKKESNIEQRVKQMTPEQREARRQELLKKAGQ